MSDFLMAIFADRNTCKPYMGPGRVGHVVRVTNDPHPTVINEFTDGGANEHADCAPASLQSWLLDRTTTRTSIREIEQLAGTGPNGTGWKGIEVAGLHFGYEIKFSTDNPTAGYVMNPGGGYVDPPSVFASYLAATQGGCLVLPNVGAPIPHPPTGDRDLTPEEHQWLSDVHEALFAAAAPEGSAPWNNNEIIRRELVQLGADYNLHPGPIPAPKAGTP